ncbi:MAG: hypothetical protein SAL70_37525 [Scytonema sp. PMC 1070.18]|nr:hypothetical protein [Scytonema sp. PMC 1070.18]
MNTFSYIIGATVELQQGLIIWIRKIEEYLNLYYQGDKENAKNTTFFNCMAKVEVLDELLISRHDDFRGVKDAQGILQSACIIEVAQIDIDDQSYTGLAIESLTNAPWNTIAHPQPETRSGGATSLIEELVRESQCLQFNGIVKAITIPSARPFYRKIGFIETNGSGEMILTPDAAQEFLTRQQRLREAHHDTGN